MLHVTNRTTLCAITRAIKLSDYLTEVDSPNTLTDTQKYLIRIEAQTSGEASADYAGADAEAVAFLSEYIGTRVSCLIDGRDANGVEKALSTLETLKGKKVPFTIYEASVNDILAEIGKSGKVLANSDTKKRYSRLNRSYFGALGESRANDAANAFLQETAVMLENGWEATE